MARKTIVRVLPALLVCLLFWTGWAAPTCAQPTETPRVTLERLFSDDYFEQERFGPARWAEDGASYTTVEPTSAGEGQELVRYDAATGARAVVVSADQLTPPGDASPLRIEDYAWSPDGDYLLIYTNSERVWRQNTRGDYWTFHVPSGRLRKLGGEAATSSLMFAKYAPGSRRVAYVRANNLYVEDLGSGTITPLTSDGSETIINGTFDWVYEEEFGLRDGFRWSPDGTRIAYWQLDASDVRDFLLLNNTDSLYSYVIPVQYPKAGTTNSAVRVGVVSAEGGPTQWLDVPGDPRNVYVARMDWAAHSDEVVLQHLDRLQQTLQVMLGDAETGAVRTVLTEEDSAWVDVVDDLYWLDGGATFTWVSERDGWRRVYLVSRDGSEQRLVTEGDFDIANVAYVDLESGWLYYTASPDNPAQRYLFRTRLDGTGPPERLSPRGEPGTHSYDIAPGARFAFHTYSTFGTPPVTDLARLPGHEPVRTLAGNATLSKRVAALQRGDVEFFRVDGGEADLDVWLMKPPDFDSTKQYPLLVHVYGEPAGQTVVDRWGGSRYLWHLMLTQQGYLVASVDNRGTPSLRGRDWRKIIYGAVGVLASEEQAAAARAIAQRPYVDAERIGVWGWSGGGSMTLNLLFRSPDVYRMGMSVAPVPDQRLYDTIYQERYMGLPQENPEGYRQGSPLTFADQLEGDLLVVHGTGDDNVHYQGTERLVNALVAANKPFTMMAYPNRSHGIFEGEGTQRHLFELLTRYLHEHLPVGLDETTPAEGGE
ncbi:MAG: S9 family peptidase [Rhodothermales bacterium]